MRCDHCRLFQLTGNQIGDCPHWRSSWVPVTRHDGGYGVMPMLLVKRRCLNFEENKDADTTGK